MTVCSREKNAWTIENDLIKVEIDAFNLWFEVIEKKSGVRWVHDPWNDSLGKLVLIRKDEKIHRRTFVSSQPYAYMHTWRGLETGKEVIFDLSRSVMKEVEGNSEPYNGYKIVLSDFTRDRETVKGSLTYCLMVPDEKAELKLELIDFKLEDVRYVLRQIHLPLRGFPLVAARDKGYLVYPSLQGSISPVGGKKAGFVRWAGHTWTSGLQPFQFTAKPNMRWFGAVKGRSSYVAIMKTSDDALVHFIGNDKVSEEKPRISSLHPVWLSSYGTLRYRRVLSYHFIPDGGYVQMAKVFREYAIKNGLYKPLREKVRQLPATKKLLGSPIIWLCCGFYNNLDNVEVSPRSTGYTKAVSSFKEVRRLLHRFKEKYGVEKAFVVLASWERRGCAFGEPDHWPPCPELGGLEEFKKIFSETAKELPNYLVTFYNVYNDMYMNAPSYDLKWMNKDADGSPTLGGWWMGGQARVICSSQYRNISDPHFAEYEKHIENLESIFIDNVLNLKECYDKNHPQTRSEDRHMKTKFLQHIVKKRKMVVGSEFGVDWEVPYVQYTDGNGSGVHRNEALVMTPLWDLVYHDAVVNYGHHWNTYTYRSHYHTPKDSIWEEQILQSILCANPGTWGTPCVWNDYEYWGELMKQIDPIMSRLSKALAFEEMVDHKFLSEDMFVQMSKWSDGTEIYVNFSDTNYKERNIYVPAKGFHIKNSPIGTLTRRFKPNLVTE